MNIRKSKLLAAIVHFFVSGTVIVFAVRYLYLVGYVRDELSITGPSNFFTGIGLYLTLLIALFILIVSVTFLFSLHRKTKLLPLWISLFFLLEIMMGVNLFFAHGELDRSEPKSEYITPISLSQLNELEDGLVYIGRPTCPQCKETYSQILITVNEMKKGNIFYYNTQKDRNSNPEEMNEILEKLKVNTVPAVLFLKNGKVEAYLKADTLVPQLKEYLSIQSGT